VTSAAEQLHEVTAAAPLSLVGHASAPAAGPRTGDGVARQWQRVRAGALILTADVAGVGITLTATGRPLAFSWALAVVTAIWLAATGGYRLRLRPSLRVDFLPLIGAVFVPVVVAQALPGATGREVLVASPLVVLAVLAGRMLSYATIDLTRRSSGGAERTLIVGAGALGCQVAESLLAHREYGLVPVGFVDGFADGPDLPLPIVGDIDSFDDAIRATGASRVIVAFGANREAEIVEVLRTTLSSHVEIHIIPRLFELGVTPEGPDTDMVWGFPMQHARRAALRTPAWRSKRIVDFCVAAVVLLVASPVMLLAALAVKVSSPGPVLFRQRRLGQRGAPVDILKFRSMRINDESDTRWGQQADDRVTFVGRVLRRTDIDELPQMINVLRGDMSLVGPRPERPHFADTFDRHIFRYRERLRVPVGLTGWAQIHGLRGDTSIEERARFDNYYIEHWSPWFDMVILARTFAHVLRRIAAAVWELRPGRRDATPSPQGRPAVGAAVEAIGATVEVIGAAVEPPGGPRSAPSL
jgi:exopolysaccharide biosynthesis polyprenyl glycosylphosphotransferase